MIFRIDKNKQLHKIDISAKDESAFLKAQDGGKIEFLQVDFSELPEIDNRFKKHFFKLEDEKIVIDLERVKEAWFEDSYRAIRNHIYSNYSQQKQSQDDKWASAYITKLKAMGVEDLEKQVVTMATDVFQGKSVDEVVVGIEDATQKAMFAKLVKVAVRTQWAEDCVIEGKKAIEETREPEYLEFPQIG